MPKIDYNNYNADREDQRPHQVRRTPDRRPSDYRPSVPKPARPSGPPKGWSGLTDTGRR
jgi:hypothetical protein